MLLVGLLVKCSILLYDNADNQGLSPRDDLEQPANQLSLIRVFAVHLINSYEP